MMRKYFVLLLLGLAFMGCREKEVRTEEKKVALDEADYVVDAAYPVFASEDEGTNASLGVLNRAMADLVDGLVDSLTADATAFFREWAEAGEERPAWRYGLTLEDSVFMASPDFVSVRLTAYEFRGGAHGMTAFYAFNYDVKNQKLLKNEEILDYGKSAEVDAALKANFRNPQGCFNLDPTLADVTVVNVSSDSLLFTYEQYVLGPYACGVAEVSVPRASLGSALLPR